MGKYGFRDLKYGRKLELIYKMFFMKYMAVEIYNLTSFGEINTDFIVITNLYI